MKLAANAQAMEEREPMQMPGIPARHQADLQGLLGELHAEREARSCRDAELHERLGREVGVLARRLEEHRLALAEDLADTIEHMDQQWMKLDKACKLERRERSQEGEEIRAILGSVWQKAQGQQSKAGYRRPAKGEDQDLDQTQDVNTVYEMAREALGDIVHLRKQLVEEQESRKQEQQVMERQVRTIKALLNDGKDAPV